MKEKTKKPLLDEKYKASADDNKTENKNDRNSDISASTAREEKPKKKGAEMTLEEREKERQQAKAQRKVKIQKALRFKQKRLAFPYAILVAVFVIVPLVIMLVEAFRGTDGGFTLSNFGKFWAEGKASVNLWKTLLKTMLLALLTTLICLVLSYPLALALTKLRASKRGIIILLFVAPMWINSLLRIYAIKMLFGDVLRGGFGFTLIGMVYDFLPFMLLPVYTCLAGLDGSLVEAAGDLGASQIGTLLKVKLPLSVPGIVSGVVMVFMPAMSTFAVSNLLGGTRLTLFGNLIENKMVGFGGHGEGAAYSMALLVLMAIIFFGANRFSKTKGSARGEGLL